MEAPDERRMIVFSRGVRAGLNVSTPMGGHLSPISVMGERLL